jgi:hypothetical protein
VIRTNLIGSRRRKRLRALIRKRLRLLGWHLEPRSRLDTGATVPTNAHPITGQEDPDSPRTKPRVKQRVVAHRAHNRAVLTRHLALVVKTGSGHPPSA